MNYQITRIADCPQLLDAAARWFHEKWGVPLEAYEESMRASLTGQTVPQWYLAMEGSRIIGGLGVIDNDFHDRVDLTPNVCAVYTEPDCRCRGVAGKLLDVVCNDMAARGIETLYLATDHASFYERYGWKFHSMVQGDGESMRLYVHENTEIKPGRYRHYKGNEYRVLFQARHSETEEQLVIYRALYGDGGLWARPASMWKEVVEVDGKQVRRFEYIGE